MITLTGQPKSTQTCYKYACRGNFPTMYMTKECKDLKESYQWQAKAQYKEKITDKDIEIVVRLYFGTKRKADIDNFNKLILDSLTGIVWEDDSQIIKMTISKHYDKENPRAEIELSTCTYKTKIV